MDVKPIFPTKVFELPIPAGFDGVPAVVGDLIFDSSLLSLGLFTQNRITVLDTAALPTQKIDFYPFGTPDSVGRRRVASRN